MRPHIHLRGYDYGGQGGRTEVIKRRWKASLRRVESFEINEITDDFEKRDDLDDLEKPLKELYTDPRLESRPATAGRKQSYTRVEIPPKGGTPNNFT